MSGIAGLAATGTGFGLYVNGERFIFETTALPADGTVWTLRSFKGATPVTNEDALDPSGYTYDSDPAAQGGSDERNILIPGLTFSFVQDAAASLAPITAAQLETVHTVPDPYYVTSALEVTGGRKIIKFVNLPDRAIIRIYSVSGSLVDVIEHNDPSGGGEAEWGVRNRNEQFVASGVYFYHIEAEGGLEKIGRMTVVNQAQ